METERAAALLYQLPRGGGPGRSQSGAGGRYSPAIIFQHYRELVPAEAKAWFSITPGQDGKIIFFEPPKNVAKAEPVAEKAVPAAAAAQGA